MTKRRGRRDTSYLHLIETNFFCFISSNIFTHGRETDYIFNYFYNLFFWRAIIKQLSYIIALVKTTFSKLYRNLSLLFTTDSIAFFFDPSSLVWVVSRAPLGSASPAPPLSTFVAAPLAASLAAVTITSHE